MQQNHPGTSLLAYYYRLNFDDSFIAHFPEQNSTDRQRIEAFVRRGIRCGFCCSDNRTSQELVEESDQSLFKRVLNDTYHVLNCLLPDERHYCYNLRDRAHNRELHITSRLLDCNFLTRLLFKDSY